MSTERRWQSCLIETPDHALDPTSPSTRPRGLLESVTGQEREG